LGLEIARLLAGQRREWQPVDPLPLPAPLRDAINSRLGQLSAATAESLAVCALMSRPTLDRLTPLLGSPVEALAEAMQAGVVTFDDGVVRFSHPLFASVLADGLPTQKRRVLHLRIAVTSDDAEEHARHLGLGSDGPDETVVAALEAAASIAQARAATDAAAELMELARDLTPSQDSAQAQRRSIEAAEHRFQAGDTDRARILLEKAVAHLPPSPLRARALGELGEIFFFSESVPHATELFRQALTEVESDLAARARIELQLSLAVFGSGDAANGLAYAEAALGRAREVGDPAVEAHALASFIAFSFFLGRGPLPNEAELALALAADPTTFLTSIRPAVFLGPVLKWSDQFDLSRQVLQDGIRDCEDAGGERELSMLLYHLAELECWAGNWDRADEHARRGDDIAVRGARPLDRAATLYARGLVLAHRGRLSEAQALVDEGLQMTSNLPVITQLLSVQAFIRHSGEDPVGVLSALDPVRAFVGTTGLADPGLLRALPDALEAMIALGQLDGAEDMLASFEASARSRERIWALGVAARCRALLAGARQDLPGALQSIQEALEHLERLPMPFEMARTLLVQGGIERRSRRRQAARDVLTRALNIFDTLGAPMWAAKTRDELARTGRSASGGMELTDSERRIAGLVAAGGSNRQVADELFISVHTVHSALAAIYRKLGVNTRTELALRWAARGDQTQLRP
jgi:DNA-binding CsgD family transcriptional regulator